MIFTDDIKKYKKVFVFGTGGGNDILSAIIPALQLQSLGLKVDIGGVLSPAATHTFDEQKEQVINKIHNVERYIELKNGDLKNIGLIDNHIQAATKTILGESEFYDISIRFGTDRLVNDFNKFIREHDYDLVVAVDVGGDILGTTEDPTLLSPMMDFTSLYLLRHLEVDNYLVEFGIGTDGELRPGRIDAILNELKDETIKTSTLSIDDFEIKEFENVFNSIKHIRAGHTNTMLLKTLRTDKDIITEYKYRIQIDDKKWLNSFMIKLDKKYHGKVWLFDGKAVSEKRKDTAFSYKTSIEQLTKLKQMCDFWKTEMDLFYINGKLQKTPSLSINPEILEEIKLHIT
jgi:hypothetical protein